MSKVVKAFFKPLKVGLEFLGFGGEEAAPEPVPVQPIESAVSEETRIDLESEQAQEDRETRQRSRQRRGRVQRATIGGIESSSSINI